MMAVQPRSRAQAFWPSVIDLEAAKAASRYGYWTATLCAVIPALLVLFHALGIKPSGASMFVAWALINVTIFAFIAWGINRYSRTAAVLGLVIFLSGRVFMWTDLDFLGRGITLLASLYFVQGIRGTFAYHRHRARNSSVESRELPPSNPDAV